MTQHQTDEWSFPASYGQERVWLASQLDPDSPVFNLPCRLAIDAALTPAQVTEVLRQVVARHEALRTSLRMHDGELRQVVHRTVPIDVTVHDLRDEQDPLAATLLLDAASAAQAIPMTDGPLWRATLCLRPGDLALTFVVHHAVFDAASVGVLTAELDELCSAMLAGREPALPELAIQYADYSSWQRGDQSAETLGEHLAYWRERLADLPGVHTLALDRPRPAELGYAGAEVRFDLDPALVDRVAECAVRLRATPYMVLLSAYAVLLGGLGDTDDVVVGMTTAGRDLPELAPLIGMFVNQSVARIDLSGAPTVADLVDRVRGTVLDAMEHGRVPFQLIVDDLVVARDPAVSPLYQLGFNYIPDSGLEPVAYTTTKDDLAFDIARTEGRLLYRTDLFDATTARRIADRYLLVLTELLVDPDRAIADLALLDDAETARINDWSHSAWPTDPTRLLPAVLSASTLPGAVAAVAAERPDALAVVDAHGELTYRQLLTEADAVAATLRGLGVGPGAVVAACAAPSCAAVAGLLGVLRAGAAYLPLDPANPAERLTWTLADAGARVLLGTGGITAPEGVTVLDLTDLDPTDVAPTHTPVSSDDVAYVIYTSGSTGEPKGVRVQHDSALSYLRWAVSAYPGLAGQSLLHSSLAFDLTVTALWGPLLAGGSVRAAALTEADAPPVAPTFVKATPSHLDLLTALPATLSPTQDLVLGGEALTAEALSAWRARHPGVAVTNEYGPTEVTVGCVAHRVEPGVQLAPGPVSIGRPVGRTRCVVLDRHGRPAPEGVVGELVLGGEQVARDYLGRPELTAQRFVDVAAAGGRAYRTGDRARWRADGTLDYLGRADEQVKLRGYRIEPGEIAAVLRAAPGVRDAAVVLREDVVGDPRLVGYPVVDAGVDLDPVWSLLRSRLPEHMVPAALVAVDALPLTTNGKLDRSRLPVPPTAQSADDDRAPATAAEELVAEVFAELLGVERIGVGQDFFALGGNSLLAIRAMARIRAQVEVDIPVRGLFSYSTVADLAAEIERRLAEELDQLTDDEVDRLLAAENPR